MLEKQNFPIKNFLYRGVKTFIVQKTGTRDGQKTTRSYTKNSQLTQGKTLELSLGGKDDLASRGGKTRV